MKGEGGKVGRERTAKGGKGRTRSERNRTAKGTEHDGGTKQAKKGEGENRKRHIRTDKTVKEQD
jgi:hypothetical protein